MNINENNIDLTETEAQLLNKLIDLSSEPAKLAGLTINAKEGILELYIENKFNEAEEGIYIKIENQEGVANKIKSIYCELKELKEQKIDDKIKQIKTIIKLNGSGSKISCQTAAYDAEGEEKRFLKPGGSNRISGFSEVFAKALQILKQNQELLS